eukprot:c14571_g1_i1.p1 GENE.c14571_g1_i1~~c14571_g1_i1.p1  ORF type:complete len:142 (-),score=10.44 c14571_g1_i1:290-715(-)
MDSLIANPKSPVKERELVPYFPPGEVSSFRHSCLQSPKGVKPLAKDHYHPRKSDYSPTSRSPKSPKLPPEPRKQYAGPAYVNSPPPDTLPIPSFLLASKFEQDSPTSQGSSDFDRVPSLMDSPLSMDPSTHLKQLLKIPVK